MIHRSQQTAVTIPDVLVSDYILGRADAFGDKPALIDGASGQVLGYAEFAASVRASAAGLAAAGVAPGSVVGVLTHNQPAFAVVYHAVAAAGAAITPINILSTATEIAAQLRAGGARVLVTAEATAAKAIQAASLAGIDRLYVLGRHPGLTSFDELAHEGGHPPVLGLDPALTLAALPFSSGTTGIAKGVMLTHRNLVASLAQYEPVVGIDRDDVLVAFLPFSHIYGQTNILNCSLAKGATIVTLPRFDLRAYLEAVQKYRATWAHLVPPVVLALATAPEVDQYDLSSLRRAMSAAAPLDAELAARAEKRLGVRVRQAYGLTEAAPGVLYISDEDLPAAPAGSVGRLMPGTELRLVDPETGEDDPGEGEAWVRGPQVMAGYLDAPDATAETITADGWLRTGDLLRVDENGFFFVVDRLKELIKYKGYQVAPAELESLLLTHPQVTDAAVIGVPHESAGEAPVAFVVAATDRDISADDLLAWVAERVAPYKRIRGLEFVGMIPRSPSGKILRRQLRERT